MRKRPDYGNATPGDLAFLSRKELEMDRDLEYALFVIGNQGDGKSTQLRDLKREILKKGLQPWKTTKARVFHIAYERWIYIRASSPQEWPIPAFL